MEDKIKDLLQNGPILNQDIAIKLGKRKTKDIQKCLNKLLKQDIIKKDKKDNRIQWSLVVHDDVYVNDVTGGNTSEKNKIVATNHESQRINKETQCEQNLVNPSYQDLLQSINKSNKEEIDFLRNEIKQKNELISSQQHLDGVGKVSVFFTSYL